MLEILFILLLLIILFYWYIVSIIIDLIIWIDKNLINKKYWKRINKRKK